MNDNDSSDGDQRPRLAATGTHRRDGYQFSDDVTGSPCANRNQGAECAHGWDQSPERRVSPILPGPVATCAEICARDIQFAPKYALNSAHGSSRNSIKVGFLEKYLRPGSSKMLDVDLLHMK